MARETLINRDILFDEDSILSSKVETEVMSSGSNGKQDAKLKVEHIDSHQAVEKSLQQSQKGYKSLELDNYQLVRDKERRITKMTKKYGIADLISYALIITGEVSSEAMCKSDKSKWLATMEEEITSLKKNNTWILVKRPLNKRLMGCK